MQFVSISVAFPNGNELPCMLVESLRSRAFEMMKNSLRIRQESRRLEFFNVCACVSSVKHRADLRDTLECVVSCVVCIRDDRMWVDLLSKISRKILIIQKLIAF